MELRAFHVCACVKCTHHTSQNPDFFLWNHLQSNSNIYNEFHQYRTCKITKHSDARYFTFAHERNTETAEILTQLLDTRSKYLHPFSFKSMKQKSKYRNTRNFKFALAQCISFILKIWIFIWPFIAELWYPYRILSKSDENCRN